MSTDLKFGKVRSFLWPVHRSEFKKFFPMFAMFFLMAFNYNILRAAKDTLVVTDPSAGAEAIPFIKVWAILPMAIFMTFVFTKLSSKYSKEKVFNIMILIFLSYFTVFTFLLYPNRDILHPIIFASKAKAFLPQGFSGLVSVFGNWTLTTFYVMAELWGTAILTVLFFGMANDITTISEAKRFYSLFGVGANVAGIISGQAAVYLSSNKFFNFISYGKTSWEQSVLFMNLTIIISGFGILFLLRYLSKNNNNLETFEESVALKKPKKEHISLKKSFMYLAKSKYLICIAIIVLAYNLTTHIIEVVWKNQIKELYPNPSEFSAYLGNVMTWIGVLATLIALFIAGNFIRRFKWSLSAIITPIVVLGSGILFFSFYLFKDTKLAGLATFLGSTPLMLSVFFGSMQNTLSRACKYTVFDATKEIAFIPLNQESKLKGKAAIDGVGSRFGKSFGSLLTSFLLIVCSTLSASAPYIAIIFLVSMVIWLIAVMSLGKQFSKLSLNDNKQIIEDKIQSQNTDTKELNNFYPFAKINRKDKIKK
ncbi:MAG: ADP,ATP carrier protein 1 [Candidatus Anoxychlamydiales bacterium]|nr:ADP,ATP carrier protein 1 [Candidatus Anoxychlamydiales bacterium]